MGRTKKESGWIKEYMKIHGIALRTAQEQRQKKHPNWLEFVRDRAHANEGDDESAQDIYERIKNEMLAAGIKGVDDDPRPIEEQIEEAAIKTWKVAKALLDNELEMKGQNISQFIRALTEAQKSLSAAKKDNERQKKEAGLLVPATKIDEIRRVILQSLRLVINNMPKELAPLIDPLQPSVAFGHLSHWVEHRFGKEFGRACDSLRAIDIRAEPLEIIDEAMHVEPLPVDESGQQDLGGNGNGH